MTTGATGFTRAAGWAGLLALLLMVDNIAAPSRAYGWGAGASMRAESMLALVCGVIFFIGLIARHRGLWWVTVAVWLLAPSAAIGLVFLLGGAGDDPIVGVAAWVMRLTLAGVMLGVFLAGELPRPATFLLLVTGALDREEGWAYLGLATMVISLTGYAWLAWAMTREPLDELVHGSPVPA